MSSKNIDINSSNPITDAYEESIGSIQGLKLLTHMGVLSLLGKQGAKAISPLLTRNLKGAMPGADITKKKLGRLGALGGGLVGAYTGSRGLDYSSARDFMKSLYTKDYWEKNPQKVRQRVQNLKKKVKGMDYNPDYSLLTDTSNNKTGAEYETIAPDFEYGLGNDDNDGCSYSAFTPSIPVKESQDIINQDQYMHPFGKTALNGMLENADKDRDDKTSQFDLSDAALKAGAGFVPSYLLGRSVGSLLRLPKDSKKRLSNIGGLAGAVANTGLFNK